MIYETAVVLRAEIDEGGMNSIKEMITKTIAEFDGEILIHDDWGMKTFAQPFTNGAKNGRYVYYMYRANTEANKELDRKCRINEGIHRSLIVKLGSDVEKDKLAKAYRRPGTVQTEDVPKPDYNEEGMSGDRKFSPKKRNCWFSANKTGPDWKDPSTYAWIVNEFGKISAARVSGLTPKFQRAATSAIKRGRCLGLISYVSNHYVR